MKKRRHLEQIAIIIMGGWGGGAPPARHARRGGGHPPSSAVLYGRATPFWRPAGACLGTWGWGSTCDAFSHSIRCLLTVGDSGLRVRGELSARASWWGAAERAPSPAGSWGAPSVGRGGASSVGGACWCRREVETTSRILLQRTYKGA